MATGTLPRSWTAHWAERPDQPVLREPDGDWWTAARLNAETSRLAGRFQGGGLRPGDRLVLSASPSARLVAVYVAALRAGLVVVPVNTAYGAEEIRHIVRDAEPALVLTDDGERARWFADAGAPRVLDLDLALPEQDAQALDRSDPGDPALLCYTSGTTGAPKGALLSHGNLFAGAEALRQVWHWEPRDRLVLALPLFHLHGLGIALNGTLHAGASFVLLPRFEPGEVLDAVTRYDATLFFGVPTMYHRLATHADVGALRELRLCVSGSAPLPVDLFERIEAATGHRIVERYGLSETIINASNPVDGERRPGTVGLPLPGVEIRLADDGEILVRGPNVFAGYWRNPEATAKAFRDGWFATGDLGEFDDLGYLRIVGRSKDLIISGGYNVYPLEVEEVLRRHDGVADATVVGRPDEEWGERVVAYVVPAAEVTDEELREFVAGKLAPYKRPKRYHFIDELPRNALGKVLRHELPDTT